MCMRVEHSVTAIYHRVSQASIGLVQPLIG